MTTGKDSASLPISAVAVENPKPKPKQAKDVKNKASFYDLLAGAVDSPYGSSNQKSVSSAVLQANKEWVFKNNDVIAKEVSKIDFELYQTGISKGEITYTEIEEHPLLDFLDQINAYTTKANAFYNTQSHIKITGDSFWLLHRNGNTLTGATLLQPDKIELILGDPTSEDRIILGYKYTDVINGKREQITYDPEEILHFKTPNPNNPYRGYGTVEALCETIDLDNLSTEVNKQFFKNGAISNFVLSTDAKVNQDQLKRIKAEFRSAYTGIKNAFKVIILGGGLKPEVISPNNRDTQFMEQLAWYRDKIMVGFGNTKASLGIVDDVNRASYDGAYYGWLNSTVKPDMKAIVDTLNEFLVPLFGDNLVLGFENPIPEDRTNDINEAVQLKNAGIISLNEARESLGYDPAPGGDNIQTTPNQPQDPNNSDNQQRVFKKQVDESIPKSLRGIDIKRALRRQKMFTKLHYNIELKEAIKPIAEKIIKGKKTLEKSSTEEKRKNPYFTNEQLRDFYTKQNNVVDIYDDLFKKKLQDFINKIRKEVLSKLEADITDTKSLSKAVKKQLIDKPKLIVEAQLDLRPILLQEATAAGLQAFNLIGKDEPYIPYKIADIIKENVAKFASSMLDTDQDTMTSIIQSGIEEGKSVPEIRDLISSRFDDIEKTQAEVITRTEVLRTSTLATEDAYQQSGVVEAKQWLTASDPDEECAKYDGKIVRLGGNFYTPENEFEDGNPPIHPNCRCVLVPVVTESKDYGDILVKSLNDKVTYLESQIDKRTKEFKEIKQKYLEEKQDDRAYIKALEKHLGTNDDKK